VLASSSEGFRSRPLNDDVASDIGRHSKVAGPIREYGQPWCAYKLTSAARWPGINL
jgi:hypothetical protein